MKHSTRTGRASSGWIARTCRNHALEHATLHLLASTHRDTRLVGHASPWGFVLMGALSPDAVNYAAREGLRRLRHGEQQLAIHPRCGTNLALAALLATLGALAGLGELAAQDQGGRQRLRRLPLAIALATLGVLVAQPLGPILQSRLTTQSRMGELRIRGMTRRRCGPLQIYHIYTEG